MTRFVSSYNDSFAPGTFLRHSGDSAKASSALHALDTRMPGHDPGFVVLLCPAAAGGAKEKSVARRKKNGFAVVESVRTDRINSRPSFPIGIRWYCTPDRLAAQEPRRGASRELQITHRLELWVEESVQRSRREPPQAISPGFPESRKWRDSQARRYSSGTPPRYPARAFAARPQRPRENSSARCPP